MMMLSFLYLPFFLLLFSLPSLFPLGSLPPLSFPILLPSPPHSTLDHSIMLSQDGILIYPEMYVLKDGYANFFRSHPDLGEPHFYLVRERERERYGCV